MKLQTKMLVLFSGGGAPGFWTYNPALQTQDLLQVSVFGDSIIAGTFNKPKASRIYTPETAASIMALDSARTTVTGSELATGTPVKSSGVTGPTGGVFTLTGSVGDTNPRFNYTAIKHFVAGELYRVQVEIDTTNSVGDELALRLSAYNQAQSSLVIADQNPGGDDTSTAGYVTEAFVISADYWLSLAATAWWMNVGGEIVSTAGTPVGLLKNLSCKLLTRGVSVINQGVNGDTSTAGLARITAVTNWTPEVCVVAFGANDIQTAGNVDTLLATYLSNLTSIVSALVAAGVYPVLATLTPMTADRTHASSIPTWNAAIANLASTLHCGFWDRWAALNNGDLTYIEDGAHPTRAGYVLLGQSLADKIRNG